MTADVTLRRATLDDLRFLFELRNDPAVVEASASGSGVDWRTHLLWFDHQLRKGSIITIVECDGERAGYLRFDPLPDDPGTYEVAVGLTESRRNEGIGRVAIALGSRVAEALGASRLVALIKPDNRASRKAFEAAGYGLDPETPRVTSSAGVVLDRLERRAASGRRSERERALPRSSCGSGSRPQRKDYYPVRTVLACDFGEGAGAGHLRRMVALGEALSSLSSGFAVALVGGGAEGDESSASTSLAASLAGRPVLTPEDLASCRGVFDAAAIDSYSATEGEWTRLDPALAVVDGDPPPISVPLLVDPSPGASESNYTRCAKKVLVGADYALLTSPFWDFEGPPVSFPPRTVLVNLGSAGSGDLTARSAAALREALPEAEVVEIEGLAPPEVYLSFLKKSDLVVTAAGVASLEAARAGRPAVGVALRPNQVPNVVGLSRAGAMLQAEPSPESIVTAVTRLASNPRLFAETARAGPQAVDGQGACRVASELLAHLSGAGSPEQRYRP